jgi:8-oxo-dGTP pyrophosphatase MutT (NUDIX family)
MTMSRPSEILKVGLAVTDADRLLVVRKRGAPSYILPGGKPEQGEDDLQAFPRILLGLGGGVICNPPWQCEQSFAALCHELLIAFEAQEGSYSLNWWIRECK